MMLAQNNLTPVLLGVHNRKLSVAQAEELIINLIEMEKKASFQQGYAKGYAHGQFDCKSLILNDGSSLSDLTFKKSVI